jgi:hypothetical protein
MYLGGLSYAGTLSRPVPAASTSVDFDEVEVAGSESNDPGYFRTISSISHASLAAAYQAMRSHDITLVPVDKPLPGEPDQEPSVAKGAIASGAGIPVAMSAYAEVLGDADAA